MCVGRCKRLYYCCAVVEEREVPLLLPHPGRGPAQSAERVWPKRGSDVKEEEFVGFAERGGLVSRSGQTREETKASEKGLSVWK